jgi:protein gp37
MEHSKIEWTDHTFNPWIGCQHVSPGCDHCYAETQNAFPKWNGGVWGPHAPRKRTSAAYWTNPVKWNAIARKHGHRPRVFCASLADVFDNQVQPEWRQDLFALIRACYELDWLMLTKRPQNIVKMLPSDWGRGYQNVWLGLQRRIRRTLTSDGKSPGRPGVDSSSFPTSPPWDRCDYRNTIPCPSG